MVYSSLLPYLIQLDDPRSGNAKKHKLIDVLFISVCATVAGAKSWTDIADFAAAKLLWFKKYIELPDGVPSHDTFRRVFCILDPVAFREIISRWIHSIHPLIGIQDIISIDGKAIRASKSSKKKNSHTHILNAFSNNTNLNIAQIRTLDKSNEITTIPFLLDMLNIEGSTITLDAMGCQTNVVDHIIDKKGHYMICLKHNQRGSRGSAEKLFNQIDTHSMLKVHEFTCESKSHDRLEARQYTVISLTDPKINLMDHQPLNKWQNLSSIVKVSSWRKEIGSHKKLISERYFITDHNADAETMAQFIRTHWNVENKLHWVLDMAFREDLDRKRAGASSENFAIVRNIALSLLRKEETPISIQRKQNRAAWDDTFLERVILGYPQKNDSKIEPEIDQLAEELGKIYISEIDNNINMLTFDF
jgi:predicted transposase YbfD/YdcC